MHILVSGSHGLIGSALIPFLKGQSHQVSRLVRQTPKQQGEIHWDPIAGSIDAASLDGLAVVVHLAGENIASGRWTAARKATIRDSRVRGTRLLSESVAKLGRPPRVLVSASAIGYYGNRGDERLTETSHAGSGFLCDVCQEWEGATEPALKRGIRVVSLRIGVVLSPKGGALAKMLPPFRMGVGGKIGGGNQHMSWIAIDDLVGIIAQALSADALAGPVNAVAPNPVTNAEFTKALGRVLGRPTFFPMPAFAARLAFGEMADELLLASARVEPTKLLAGGYRFQFPKLEPALCHLLNKST